MWSLTIEWQELILRSLCVFVFLFITFRIWGKKHFGELAPFDFLLLLIISESVQNALVVDDNSLTASFITILTLVLLNVFLGKVTFHSKKLEQLVDGEPSILIKNGKIIEDVRIKQTLTMQEVHQALRMEGVLKTEDVELATIETNGKISIVKKG